MKRTLRARRTEDEFMRLIAKADIKPRTSVSSRPCIGDEVDQLMKKIYDEII